MLRAPSYNSDTPDNALSTIPVERFFGINQAVNHKSETQLKGWQDLMDRMYKAYNESPLGRRKPINPLEFARFMTGMITDHAEDQKKLVRMLEAWKVSCEREMRGQEALLTASLADLMPMLVAESERNVAEAGGLEAWNMLPADVREAKEITGYRRFCCVVGEQKLNELTPEERQYAALFLWAGCCMHKEMNSGVGGAKRMMEWWKINGVEGPLTLFNKDNAAAAKLGGHSAQAQERAMAISQGGAIKLTSLAGAVFANKDTKKGQQDSLQVFLQNRVGYMVRFPGTSSTRYGSYAEAAAELIIRYDFYLQFLELVRDVKEKGTFTNIEDNIYRGLQDIPTLTEMCALVFYAQSVTHPYLRQVRGAGAAGMNNCDLGPLHDKVLAHCKTIIANPDLLLSPGASCKMGSLDGEQWQRPDGLYAVWALMPKLPHIRPVVVAFFEGAAETWLRFITEYSPDSRIASASAAERQRAFLPPTNDVNEGALGTMRIASRHAPNSTLESQNARTMYRKNNTGAFISKCLSPEDQAYLRRKAREMDSSGIARKRRTEQAEYDEAEGLKKRKRREAWQDRCTEKQIKIGAVQPMRDREAMIRSPPNCRELDLQLGWYRMHDKEVPKQKYVGHKDEKIAALVAAIDRYHAGQQSPPAFVDKPSIQIDVPSDLDEEPSDVE